ncbi:cell envelope protein SmpA [Pacificimonas flava]|uniref:Cell envelope protein SmpA n=2 Tax=Pacificimonas TaxID=1960290 RepID=A0A219B5G4_9SPHN|nr:MULTISPECIES: outer membrane protein assembly factor BamE [Pacificimonas]MBZ6379270.1 outer membrane protein assembly factor BamE [Pacificimonas aurantium]OWV33521.1 cell envelope protein SmpA [Pacificimonas flava]
MNSIKTSLGGANLLLLTVAASLTLSGCARIRDNQGYVRDNELISAIAPGVDNRESVERTLGRPTFQSQWDDSIWYYVSRNTEQLAFLPPTTTGQNVTLVRFDPQGNVAAVESREGMDQVAYFDPSSDETPVFGRDTGLFQEIFGNIGRVSSIPTGGGGPTN